MATSELIYPRIITRGLFRHNTLQMGDVSVVPNHIDSSILPWISVNVNPYKNPAELGPTGFERRFSLYDRAKFANRVGAFASKPTKSI